MKATGTRVRHASDLLRSPITVAWTVLIGATVGSWWLAADHGPGSHAVIGSIVLLVAFVKARLIGLYFMELRHAPIPLRLLFEVWCAAVCGLVVGMFLLA
jgi:caa(3)-type oxidase subunit IV